MLIVADFCAIFLSLRGTSPEARTNLMYDNEVLPAINDHHCCNHCATYDKAKPLPKRTPYYTAFRAIEKYHRYEIEI